MSDKLTLDTNLVQELWKQRPRAALVKQLLDLAAAGVVDLAVTRHIREDVRNEPLASRIDALPEMGIEETPQVARYGAGVYDDPASMYASDASADIDAFYDEAVELATKRAGANRVPDRRDWGHLLAHETRGRDFFLTWDRGILCLAPELKARFAVEVQTPDDYINARR